MFAATIRVRVSIDENAFITGSYFYSSSSNALCWIFLFKTETFELCNEGFVYPFMIFILCDSPNVNFVIAAYLNVFECSFMVDVTYGNSIY